MSADSLLLAVGGVVAGAFGALLGLGGGVFLIPYLVLILHVPMHQAVAASIVAVIATSSTGAAMNLERHMVNVRLAMLLETTTVAGAIAGGLTASMLDEAVLTKIFGFILIGIAVMMAISGRLTAMVSMASGERASLAGKFRDEASNSDVLYSVRNIVPTMIVSLLAGNVSGLLGLGGGIFKVPAMHVLSGVPIKAATATSNFMIGVTAAAGAFVYFAGGHLNPLIAAPAALGVLFGSFVGIRMGRILKADTLKWIFIAVLIAASFQLIIR